MSFAFLLSPPSVVLFVGFSFLTIFVWIHDLCLPIYRPVAFKGNTYDKDLTENPYPTWKKLEELVAKGKIRNIGISKCVHFPHLLSCTSQYALLSSFNIRRLVLLTTQFLIVDPATPQDPESHRQPPQNTTGS